MRANEREGRRMKVVLEVRESKKKEEERKKEKTLLF